MIKKGDRVWLRPEWQDPGEERYTYVAVSDEHDGRVDIQATNFEYRLPPINTVRVEWLKDNTMTNTNEGYTILPPIDRERYTDIPDLEGPFMLRSGKVVYYDPKEGKYYDRDSDMYMSDEEYQAHSEPRLAFRDSFNRLIQNVMNEDTDKAKDIVRDIIQSKARRLMN